MGLYKCDSQRYLKALVGEPSKNEIPIEIIGAVFSRCDSFCSSETKLWMVLCIGLSPEGLTKISLKINPA